MQGWSSPTSGCSPTRHDAFPARRTAPFSAHCPPGSRKRSTSRRWPRSSPTCSTMAGGPASSLPGSVPARLRPTRQLVSASCSRRSRTSRPLSNARLQTAPGGRSRPRTDPHRPRRRSRPDTWRRSDVSSAWPPRRPGRRLSACVHRVHSAVRRVDFSSPIRCACAPPASNCSRVGRRGWWQPDEGPLFSLHRVGTQLCATGERVRKIAQGDVPRRPSTPPQRHATLSPLRPQRRPHAAGRATPGRATTQPATR